MHFSLKNSFERWFKIYPREFGLVQSFFLYYTCVGMFYTLAVTAGDSLFLTNMDPGRVEGLLAWVYVGVAVSSVFIIWVYEMISDLVSRKRLLLGIQVFQMGIILAFRLGLAGLFRQPGEWFYFFLVIWLEMCGLLSITLFFSLAGDYFTAYSAKRVYGYIAGGLSVGTIAAGALIGPLVEAFGSKNLLFACAGLMGMCIFFALGIFKQGTPVEVVESQPAGRETDASFVYGAFVRNVFVAVFLGMICYVIVDFQMKLTARAVYPDMDDLSRFFGTCYTVVGLVQIPFQFLVVGVLLKRFGILHCLMILPCLHVAMAGLFYTTGQGFLAGYAMVIIVTANFMRMMISETLEIPSREMLFLPLPTPVRLKAQARMGGMVMPVGQGAAGVIVMGLAHLGWELHAFSLGVVFFALVWIWVLFYRVRRWYRASLISSLQHFRLGQIDMKAMINQTEMTPVFEALLDNPKLHVTAFTLDLIRKRERISSRLLKKIERLTRHQNETIAPCALRILGEKGNLEHLEIIEPLTESVSIPVKRAAIIAYCSLKQENALDRIKKWIRSDEKLVRQTALLGCHMTCTRQVDLIILTYIKELFQKRDPEQLCSAVRACKEMQLVEFVPDLIQLFKENKFRHEIASCLAAMPFSCLPVIESTMMDTGMDYGGRSLLFQAAAAVGGVNSVDTLWQVFTGDLSAVLRESAGQALKTIKNDHPEFDLKASRFELALQLLCERIKVFNAGIHEIGETDPMIRVLLTDHVGLEIHCLFLLLALKYLSRDMESIQAGFFSHRPIHRSNAGESLENMLPRPVAGRIIPLLSPHIEGLQSMPEGRGLTQKTAGRLLEMESWVGNITTCYLEKEQNRSRPLSARGINGRHPDFYNHLGRVMTLKQVPLFMDVPGNDLSPLAANARVVSLAKGMTLFDKGDIGDGLYIICQGGVQVSINGRGVNRMGKNRSIGEMSLLDARPMPRSATCTCMEDSIFLKISSQDFQRIIKTHPRASLAVLKTLARRLRRRTAPGSDIP